MNICIFEDEKYRNLNPLALSRPAFELRTGTRTLREKLLSIFNPKKVFLFTRNHLKGVLQEKDASVTFDIPAEPLLFVNGRVLPDKGFEKAVNKNETLFYAGDDLAAAQVRNGAVFAGKLTSGDYAGYQTEQLEADLIEYPWDLIERNGVEIEKEFPLFGCREGGKTAGHLLNRERIYIGNNGTILPGTVIDATEGPVIIDDEVSVMANCYLKGPLYIGKGSMVKAGTRVYGPVSIGAFCKIGGEIAASIFHGYTNKQHDGFIGHSYLGEWVNIGADTNNSDLKNNYKEVTVYINNRPVNTGLTFVGTFMGDHSKTAINTVLNTGTIVGFSVNIFGEGFPKKYIPSFSWGGKRKFMTYKLEDATETARRVMKRRNVELTEAYREMMVEIFEQTAEMRKHGS